MKIVVLDGYVENPGDLSWDPLASLGELTVHEYTAPEDILPRIGDAPILLTNKTPITAATMDACPQLKYIGVLATGFNVIDVAAAKARGIVVANVPSYGTQAVAQFVMAQLLEICHRIGHHNTAVQQGRWTACRDFAFWDYPLMELAGKTIGIVGYGRIGQATAELARAFGMKVLAYSRHGRGEPYVTLEELYEKSDIVSLHCPLTPDNAGMIDRHAIAKMKDGVILLNTARGGLINEADLREALLSGKVYAAASDVVSTEPIKADNPLLGLDNMIITPHIAWASHEARQRLMDTAIDNVRQFIAGMPVNNVAV
ncbi:MAG: D-2-hydroxyacid dehydrogenase [Clostridia bacterium]|nr:D-2-hydroxyacid dehydrogenase [Clostridia bacterium]